MPKNIRYAPGSIQTNYFSITSKTIKINVKVGKLRTYFVKVTAVRKSKYEM